MDLVIAKAKEISESIEFVAQFKEKAVLCSFGVTFESDSGDGSASEESCPDSEVFIEKTCSDSNKNNMLAIKVTLTENVCR